MSDTPAPAAPVVDDTDTPDEPISTADFEADPVEEPAEAPKEEPEKAKVEEPAEATEETPKDDLEALKAQIEALTNKLAEKEAAERAAAEYAAKSAALEKAGIPDTFARFLTGDEDSWQEQIDALTTLRGQASTAPAPSIPRDPAVDADLETEDDGLAEALEFFGIQN